MSRRVAILSNIPPSFSDIFGANYYDDWDFNNSGSLSLTGSLIDSITSQGSNGAVFSAAGTARPTLVSADINGKDVASFDGVTDYMEVSTSTAMYNFLHYGQGCAIWILKTNTPGATRIYGGTGGGTRSHRFSNTSSSGFVSRVTNGVTLIVTTMGTTTLTYSSLVHVNDTENANNSDKLYIILNKSNTYNNAVGGWAGTPGNSLLNFSIGNLAGGSSVYFKGSIARLIIINTLPTATQLTQTQRRLEYEYGIFPI